MINQPENQDKCQPEKKRSKRFIIGLVLIFGSIFYGWVGLFAFNALGLATKKPVFNVIGGVVYGMSWVTYGLGFILAGPTGVRYVKSWFRKIFRSKK